jgi:phospholipid/cholesterol/gamma-HCH transport system substrate-binding protein
MNKKPVETIMGIVVLFIAAFFLYFAYRVSDLQAVKGYEVSATFLKVGGLNIGADVRINGVKIGTVISQRLNNEDYNAEVVLSIAPDISLPKDSSAVIASNGLMGNKFIRIEPGKSSDVLKSGDKIINTKDFKTLEDMVGEVIFMVTGNEKTNN